MSAEKGSFRGKRREPLSTECSVIWETPVSSWGGVAKQNANRFSVVGGGDMQDLAARGRVPHVQRAGAVLGEIPACQHLEGADRSGGSHGCTNIRTGQRRVYSSSCYTRAVTDAGLRGRLESHARFASEIRGYFTARGYVEVETPTLSPFLIPEPAIEVFQTEYLGPGGHPRDLWLIPSPELWMKRLLGRGSGNIFQISRSFRNGDVGSPLHNPEFRLLEWYTVGSGYVESIDVLEGLFSHLLSSGWEKRHPAALPALSPLDHE